jgi:hypothetical protein
VYEFRLGFVGVVVRARSPCYRGAPIGHCFLNLGNRLLTGVELVFQRRVICNGSTQSLLNLSLDCFSCWSCSALCPLHPRWYSSFICLSTTCIKFITSAWLFFLLVRRVRVRVGTAIAIVVGGERASAACLR